MLLGNQPTRPKLSAIWTYHSYTRRKLPIINHFHTDIKKYNNFLLGIKSIRDYNIKMNIHYVFLCSFFCEKKIHFFFIYFLYKKPLVIHFCQNFLKTSHFPIISILIFSSFFLASKRLQNYLFIQC